MLGLCAAAQNGTLLEEFRSAPGFFACFLSTMLPAFLDTGFHRYRVKNQPIGNFFFSFYANFTSYGRMMTTARIGIPFGLNNTEERIDFLDQNVQKYYT